MPVLSTPLISYLRRLATGAAAAEPSDRELLRRYADGREEPAFAALVARHGPLVWRACRRALRYEQDAEDVFQATFLVLARKAGAVSWHDSVAGWLYAVATRLALKARAQARRLSLPCQRLHTEAASALDEMSARELLTVLDEQVAALPACYRDPLLLCCLEGQTQEAAASQLGISHSTLRRRLERGRQLLHDRLTRRGLALSTALGAMQLLQAPASAMPRAVPASSRAVALAASLRPVGLLMFGKIAMGVLFLGTAVALGVAALHRPAEVPAGPATATPAAEPAAEKPRLDTHGDPLPTGAVARLGSLRLYHGLDLRRVVLSPDGKLVAASDLQGTNRLWNAVSGRELPLSEAQRIAFIFAAREKLLVAEGPQGKQRLVDLATGKQVAASEKEIRSLLQQARDSSKLETVSPDGKLLVVRDGKRLRLLEAGTRKELRPLEGVPEQGAFSATFSPDGKLLAVPYIHDVPEVWLWDVATRKLVRKLKGQDYQIFDSDFSGDGKTLAAADGSGVTLWDVATGRRKHDWGHGYYLSSLAFTPDGRTLLTGAGYTDPDIRLWDPLTGKEKGRWRGHLWGVQGIAVTPDGKQAVSGSQDGTLRLWDIATGKEVRRLSDREGAVYALALAPDGKTFASAGGVIRVHEVATGKVLRSFTSRSVLHLAFSPDGKVLASSSSDDRAVRLWEVATGKELFRLDGHEQGSPNLIFSPDGRLLATGSSDGTIRLWDPINGKRLRTIDGPRQPGPRSAFSLGAIAFSPDGYTLAAGYSDQTVRLWEVATGRERGHFTEGHRAGIVSLAYSPDGQLLVSGAWDRNAVVWAATGRLSEGRKKPLDAKRAEQLWADLASADAAKAFAAVRTLSRAEGAVRLLGERLQPAEAADDKRVAGLLADLDSDDFQVRERAQRALVKVGDRAEPALRKVLAGGPSPEMLRRVERILAGLDPWQSGEAARNIRAIEVLEGIGSPEARAVLQKLARGADGARLTREAKAALERLEKR